MDNEHRNGSAAQKGPEKYGADDAWNNKDRQTDNKMYKKSA